MRKKFDTSRPAKWFRLYAEFATDPKIQVLSEIAQRRFLMLLCLRCSNGNETLQDVSVACYLRVSNEEWLGTKELLLAEGLINENSQPLSWEKRQFASDSSTDRVRTYRDRKKKANETLQKQPETLLKRQVETETETELEVKSKDGKPARKLAHQIPENFKPTPYHEKLAKQFKVNLTTQFAQFKDHHGARGSTFKDWNLALNTWIRNGQRFGGNGNGTPADRSRIVNPAVEAQRELDELRSRSDADN